MMTQTFTSQNNNNNMKGMTLEQFKKITELVNEYHGFGRSNIHDIEKQNKAKLELGIESDEFALRGLNIKYVRCDFDTRFNLVWGISFDRIRFSTNHYNTSRPAPKDWKYDNLYDLCMDYLRGEFKPKAEFYIK